MASQKSTASTSTTTPALAVTNRILRSPSHESFSTDLSLISISVSSMNSEATSVLNRSSCSLLNRTMEEKLGSLLNPKDSKRNRRSSTLTERWNESNDLIRNCATLSAALGIHKSFSTTDIYQLPSDQHQLGRLSSSELALTPFQKVGYLFDHSRLEHASRSYSTWVAVGELASTSQLPSPHGGQSAGHVPTLTTTNPPAPSFTVTDLISSVNKKIRQNYIRRRLFTTYRALERLSQSEFNLDRLEAAAFAATNPGPTELIVPSTSLSNASASPVGGKSTSSPAPPGGGGGGEALADHPGKKTTGGVARGVHHGPKKHLTFHDIENERGKPLSKYERHMLIFNWLHTIDDTALEIEN
ncbi:uncharacterized protein LOC133393657 isoform X1 [Anopheles gambiae]|uniref:uncharacterized protein LOC133393657 isoform X1 n=1 Tax=Anopheles gambiae TaxID=7165 RepID=UPI002AC8964C|nr:uncharacterized protein LOC133393657 isoform X1 [Anopheles gambiae]XP_061515453.1 uncharacterized protein LOC133393657 isoform X1 [Anopheles gambiae]